MGFWWEDEPISVGVIADDGDSVVFGGDDAHRGDVIRGPWATSILADTPEEAEQAAVAAMLATLPVEN
jgi:hypothetical protein